MNGARMSSAGRPGFWRGVGFAAVACVLAWALNLALAPLLSGAVRLQWLAGALSLFYIVFLLRRAAYRPGRFFLMASSGAVLVALPLLPLSWLNLLAAHTLLISIVRGVLFYRGLIPRLLDMALSGLALVALLWAWLSGGGLLLGVWTYFLVHSLCVLIPHRFPVSTSFRTGGREQATAPAAVPGQRFEQAYRQAQDVFQQSAAPWYGAQFHSSQSAAGRGRPDRSWRNES